MPMPRTSAEVWGSSLSKPRSPLGRRQRDGWPRTSQETVTVSQDLWKIEVTWSSLQQSSMVIENPSSIINIYRWCSHIFPQNLASHVWWREGKHFWLITRITMCILTLALSPKRRWWPLSFSPSSPALESLARLRSTRNANGVDERLILFEFLSKSFFALSLLFPISLADFHASLLPCPCFPVFLSFSFFLCLQSLCPWMWAPMVWSSRNSTLYFFHLFSKSLLIELRMLGTHMIFVEANTYMDHWMRPDHKCWLDLIDIGDIGGVASETPE